MTEARISRLESDVAELRSDMKAVRSDLAELKGRVAMLPENPAYPREEYPLDAISVIGRVVWAGGAL